MAIIRLLVFQMRQYFVIFELTDPICAAEFKEIEMNEIEVLEDIATKAVRRLRTETLKSGQPFMINVKKLPANQCYLEFPDHSIQLVTFLHGKNDFVTVRKLRARDRDRLKKRLGL